MTDIDARRARIRATKRADGVWLTDDELPSTTAFRWTAETRQVVRDALAELRHDEDCNWAPPGGVAIAVHRDEKSCWGFEAGLVTADTAFPDVMEWFTARLGEPYQSPSYVGGSLWLYTLPNGAGPTVQSPGVYGSQRDFGMCPRCSSYPLTATGRCAGGCDE
jgi:hypothetical protein